MNYIRNLLSKLFASFMKTAWPEVGALDKKGPAGPSDWQNLFNEVEAIDRETEDASFQEVKDGKSSDIPDPEFILGPGGSKWVDWQHKDELLVNFSVAENLVVEDSDFMIRYIENKLTSKEREEMPPTYYQCFADISEVVFANLNFNMVQIKDDHYCFIVGIGETIGMLILRVEDSIDIIRRSNGFVDNEKALHYHMQFMRFHPVAIDKIGPCVDVSEWPSSQPDLEMTVNFAHFEEEENQTPVAV